jgi:hypothetical protein
MKKIFLLLAIIVTSINCKQEPKVKDELKSILEKYAGFTDQPYIDVENSNIHNGKQEQHLLIKYKLEDAGVELEIAQNDIGGPRGMINISDTNKAFITYSSIQNIYIQSKWNQFDPNREKIVIVLKK